VTVYHSGSSCTAWDRLRNRALKYHFIRPLRKSTIHCFNSMCVYRCKYKHILTALFEERKHLPSSILLSINGPYVYIVL
jgi:hypothetical protein